MKFATRNTYSAKESLKECGATWDAEKKAWNCSNFDEEMWSSKMLNPTWNGRKRARLCADVVFENID